MPVVIPVVTKDLLQSVPGIDVVCPLDEDSASVARGLALIRRCLRIAAISSSRPTVVLLGPAWSQLQLVQAMVVTGLRPRVRMVCHLRVAEVPLAPIAARVCQSADLVVVESAFGARAVRHAQLQSGVARKPPVVVVPPAVAPKRVPAPLTDRHKLRIGTLASHSGDADTFEALEIFRVFATGLYWVCRDCRRCSPFAIAEGLEPMMTDGCVACGSPTGVRGDVLPDARLVIGGRPLEDHPPTDRPALWTLSTAATALGIAEQIVWSDSDLPDGLDALLLPHQQADLAPAVLDGCAAGIVTITTGFGAANDLPPERVHLVPAGVTQLDPDGHWLARMDVSAAIGILRSLGADEGRDA